MGVRRTMTVKQAEYLLQLADDWEEWARRQVGVQVGAGTIWYATERCSQSLRAEVAKMMCEKEGAA